MEIQDEKLGVSLLLEMLVNFKYCIQEESWEYFKVFLGGLDSKIKEGITSSKAYCLNYSAYFGLDELFEYLCLDIDSGTLNKADNHGTFPLLLSSINGHTKVVELLLERGADPLRAFYFEGEEVSALDAAVIKEETEVVSLLERYIDSETEIG